VSVQDSISPRHTEKTKGFIEVRAPARLHFGLVELCPNEPFQFGGIGLMIDTPATIVSLNEQTNTLEQIEEWSSRVEQAARSTSEILGVPFPKTSWHLESRPAAHVGLGSGTQLAATAATLTLANSLPDTFNSDEPCSQSQLARSLWERASNGSAAELLAACTNRGNRSHIGLYGFLHGGFVVDMGRQVPELAENSRSLRSLRHYALPQEWRVVLITPIEYEAIYGQRESDWIELCGRSPNPQRERMMKLVENSIVPNLNSESFSNAAYAIYEYSTLAGALFGPVQNGFYRDAFTAELVKNVQSLGGVAVVQSSWGPTVAVLLPSQQEAEDMVVKIHNAIDSNRISVEITQPNQSGASIRFAK